ncbi:DVU_1551 family NTP transferase [Megalodesulfovibrio gigas]|uniref:Putative metal dependent phosphohydrolase n=1 Tax=Megalodesulfovibrio gigas (strain ATCC 19364 / DSM 1382 / NCIMB 9332 / VKM B-1759) TaxID=1121448 RepID=T2G8F8_MEGG1|nr:NTP transferase domain-containing protein [Megalodesulfovibrio gigas]AGW12172.1 putative metal dependent phosphohydrolase [Megalodesulfovibrio gigas DSM 1382 = ATCC 19364]
MEPQHAGMAGLILAAGKGERMGGCKALTMLGGRTFLERIAETHREAGLRALVVVTGAQREDVQAHAAALGLPTAHNPRFEEGMFTSILAGLAALAAAGHAAACLHPVDIPCIRPATIRLLRRTWETNPHPARILSPMFDGRTGHPPVIGRDRIPEITAWTGPGGLAGYFSACNAVELVDVADAGIHLDADTPADLARLEAWLPHRDVPTLAEAEALLRLHQPRAGVVAHSRAVALAARRLAVALTTRGLSLDADTAEVAGLLHDIAKGQPDHAAVGAALVREAGFAALETAIALHPGVPAVPDDPAQQPGLPLLPAVLALADKYAAGDAFVGLEERFGRKAQQYQDNPDACAGIARRLAASRTLEATLQALLGRPPLEVVRDATGCC